MKRVGSILFFGGLAAALCMALWLRHGSGTAPRPASGHGWVDADCWLERDRPIRCGWLWPTRQDAAHRTALPVVVLQHAAAVSRTVSIHIAGGPGGSNYLEQDMLAQWDDWATQLGLNHDLVLYDARGAGRAQPSLECARFREETAAQLLRPRKDQAQIDASWAAYENALLECAARVAPADRATGLYSTPTHAQDLLELIGALRQRYGYESVVLYGVSYGSRLAVETAALAEASGRPVQRVVLDSWYPAGADLWLRVAQTWKETIDDFARWCAAQPACTLRDQWRDSMRRLLLTDPLGSQQRIVSLDDYGLSPATVTLDSSSLWLMLQRTLAGSESPEDLTQMVDDALAQRWTSAWQTAAADYAAQALDTGFSDLAFHLAECADSPPTSRERFLEEARRHPDIELLLRESPRAFDVCERLGVPANAVPSRRLLTSTLVVANRIDPITPWRVALGAFEHLAQGHFRLLDAAGHGLYDECGLAATGSFMNDGALTGWTKCHVLVEREAVQHAGTGHDTGVLR